MGANSFLAGKEDKILRTILSFDETVVIGHIGCLSGALGENTVRKKGKNNVERHNFNKIH